MANHPPTTPAELQPPPPPPPPVPVLPASTLPVIPTLTSSAQLVALKSSAPSYVPAVVVASATTSVALWPVARVTGQVGCVTIVNVLAGVSEAPVSWIGALLPV